VKPSVTARRHERFAREWVIDHNGTRAAIACGYAEKSAYVQASRLLSNAKVQRFIVRFESERASRLEIRADRVLEELARLAFLDPRKFYNDDGSLKAIHELDQDTAACLAGVEVEKLYEHFGKGQASNTGTTTKIKFHDKGQNLERLGKHLKLFTEKLELSADSALLERLLAGRKRLQSS
jgi:phage terminase small subunit